jgi:hypothetical protein
MPHSNASTEPRLTPDDSRLQQLRGLIGDKPPRPADNGPQYVPTPFDDLLGGVTPHRLVDLLAGAPGCGASLVGLWLASRACRQRGELVVIDGPGAFYPPTAIAWGVEPRRLLLVRPASSKDALAATEIALRSPAVGAVWASLERIDGRAFRRLLLAAEAGAAFGVLVRSGRHEPDPSWADVQLRLDPIPTRGDPDAPFSLRVTLRRNRHGPARGEATLTLDWRTGDINDVTSRDADYHPNALSVAPRLARPA